jgi:hypothetical protein
MVTASSGAAVPTDAEIEAQIRAELAARDAEMESGA